MEIRIPSVLVAEIVAEHLRAKHNFHSSDTGVIFVTEMDKQNVPQFLGVTIVCGNTRMDANDNYDAYLERKGLSVKKEEKENIKKTKGEKNGK